MKFNRKFEPSPRNQQKLALCGIFSAIVAGTTLFWIFLYINTVTFNDIREQPVFRHIEQVNSKMIKIEEKKEEKTKFYWNLNEKYDTGLYKLPTGLENSKYILFETDCGGFNNIRMAFEYFYLMAFITQRTLVLPPPSPWYLLDFGPFVRMKPSEKHKYLTTSYEEFYNLEHLKSGIPILKWEEFLKIEKKNLNLNSNLKANFITKDERKYFTKFIETETNYLKHLLWAPLQKIIFFPTIEKVKEKYKNNIPKTFIHHRELVEITSELNNYSILAFPSCMNNDNARYLGQIAAFIAFSDEALSRSYKRILKDFVHYKKIIFIKAFEIINILENEYISLHVRRNELQYKEVFMSTKTLYNNIKPLINSNEQFYIATDEKNKEFFKYLSENGHIFKTWDDFENITSKWKTSRKLEGCIEQVICAHGRIFFGTLESTFTSYIYRLRGYLNKDIKEVYFHTLKYKGNIEQDRKITYSKKPIRGQIYKSEHPSIWEDAISDFTFW